MNANFGSYSPAHYNRPDDTLSRIGDRFANVAAAAPGLVREGQKWGDEMDKRDAGEKSKWDSYRRAVASGLNVREPRRGETLQEYGAYALVPAIQEAEQKGGPMALRALERQSREALESEGAGQQGSPFNIEPDAMNGREWADAARTNKYGVQMEPPVAPPIQRQTGANETVRSATENEAADAWAAIRPSNRPPQSREDDANQEVARAMQSGQDQMRANIRPTVPLAVAPSEEPAPALNDSWRDFDRNEPPPEDRPSPFNTVDGFGKGWSPEDRKTMWDWDSMGRGLSSLGEIRKADFDPNEPILHDNPPAPPVAQAQPSPFGILSNSISPAPSANSPSVKSSPLSQASVGVVPSLMGGLSNNGMQPKSVSPERDETIAGLRSQIDRNKGRIGRLEAELSADTENNKRFAPLYSSFGGAYTPKQKELEKEIQALEKENLGYQKEIDNYGLMEYVKAEKPDWKEKLAREKFEWDKAHPKKVGGKEREVETTHHKRIDAADSQITKAQDKRDTSKTSMATAQARLVDTTKKVSDMEAALERAMANRGIDPTTKQSTETIEAKLSTLKKELDDHKKAVENIKTSYRESDRQIKDGVRKRFQAIVAAKNSPRLGSVDQGALATEWGWATREAERIGMGLAKRGMSKGEGKGQRGRLPSESEIQEDINYLARHYALDAAPELMTIVEDSYRKALGNTASAATSQSATPVQSDKASDIDILDHPKISRKALAAAYAVSQKTYSSPLEKGEAIEKAGLSNGVPKEVIDEFVKHYLGLRR